MRWLKYVLLGLMVLAGTAAYLAYRANALAHEPFKGYAGEEIFFTVERGAAGVRVGQALEDQGIISDQRLFVGALKLRGETSRIQAGEYRFSEPISTVGVVERLVAGDVYTFSVTIPEGLTLEETAAHLDKLGVSKTSDLVRAFHDVENILEIDPGATDLEGYLFPTTYSFTRNPSAADVSRTMVAQFKAIFNERLRAKAREVELTPREVVTFASVIEKETGSAGERPLIASVFWNRLERGMALGSDPTIIFVLKKQGVYDGNLRRVDLQLDSPYNTYRVAGLPPGPIASPGEASIMAVLEPDESDYLYFVSKNDGSHYFSKTLREHTNAVRKYQVEYFRRRRRNNGAGSP